MDNAKHEPSDADNCRETSHLSYPLCYALGLRVDVPRGASVLEGHAELLQQHCSILGVVVVGGICVGRQGNTVARVAVLILVPNAFSGMDLPELVVHLEECPRHEEVVHSRFSYRIRGREVLVDLDLQVGAVDAVEQLVQHLLLEQRVFPPAGGQSERLLRVDLIAFVNLLAVEEGHGGLPFAPQQLPVCEQSTAVVVVGQHVNGQVEGADEVVGGEHVRVLRLLDVLETLRDADLVLQENVRENDDCVGSDY